MSILSSNKVSVYCNTRDWMKINLPNIEEGKLPGYELTKTLPLKIIVRGKNVVLCDFPEKELGIIFDNLIDCGFICSHSQLTSLKGVPEKVAFFDCSFCKGITSLEGAPKEVYGDFIAIGCGKLFTEEEIRSQCRITGKVYC